MQIENITLYNALDHNFKEENNEKQNTLNIVKIPAKYNNNILVFYIIMCQHYRRTQDHYF